MGDASRPDAIAELVSARRQARRRLLGHLDRAREDERFRIISDLHGASLRSMMAVAEHLDRLRSRLGGELDEEVRELERSVEEAIEGLRRLSFDLSLGAQEEDLAGALEARLRRIRTRTGLRYRLEEQIVREPSTTTRLAALRILDEILANVCRHADATGIDVKLLAAEAVEVRVADDGAGFDVARMTAGPERMGLALMRHRAEAAGGSLLVYRSPGDGTVVEFSLPAA